MSTYDPESELSRLNRATTSDWIPVSDSLFTVLEAALEIGARSEKAFDITVGPAVNLWGFGPEFHSERIPDKSEIAAVLPAIGQDKLVLDRETHAIRKLHSDIYIDLSAIAKGYAVDRVAEIFDARGIEHYLVEIGGEIRARGTNAQNTPGKLESRNHITNMVVPLHIRYCPCRIQDWQLQEIIKISSKLKAIVTATLSIPLPAGRWKMERLRLPYWRKVAWLQMHGQRHCWCSGTSVA